jgi:hypothetical protein
MGAAEAARAPHRAVYYDLCGVLCCARRACLASTYARLGFYVYVLVDMHDCAQGGSSNGKRLVAVRPTDTVQVLLEKIQERDPRIIGNVKLFHNRRCVCVPCSCAIRGKPCTTRLIIYAPPTPARTPARSTPALLSTAFSRT